MQTFRVDDMTCGHCAATITQAVRAVDSGARVEVDLRQHLVRIETADADAQELRDAIAEAGYTPVDMPATVAVAEQKKAGVCCGCCG